MPCGKNFDSLEQYRAQERVLMLWAHLSSDPPITDLELKNGLAEAQHRRFIQAIENIDNNFLASRNEELKEYLRLLKVADTLWNKLFPKRRRKINLKWFLLRDETREAYGIAAAEILARHKENPSLSKSLTCSGFFGEHFQQSRGSLHYSVMPRRKRNDSELLIASNFLDPRWQELAREFAIRALKRHFPKASMFDTS